MNCAKINNDFIPSRDLNDSCEIKPVLISSASEVGVDLSETMFVCMFRHCAQ